MARVCCVDDCDSTTKEDITYFPLPVKPALRRAWVTAIGASRLHPHSLVCSQHFSREDCGLVRGKLRLLANRVPTIFPHRDKQTSKPVEDDDVGSNDAAQSPKNEDSNENTKKRRRKTSKKSSKRRKSNKICEKERIISFSSEENMESNENDLKNHETNDVDRESSNAVPDVNETDLEQDKEKIDGLNQDVDKTDEVNQNVDKSEPVNQLVDKTEANQEEDKTNLANQDIGNDVNQDIDKDDIVNKSDNTNEDVAKIDNLNGDSDVNIALAGLDMLYGVDRLIMDSSDGVQEKCTIECVPESILAPEEDSDQSEADIHKEDIEDIIANYHIKQDKMLADRMKVAQEKECLSIDESTKSASSPKAGSADGGEKVREDSQDDKSDGDEEVLFISTNLKPAKFIEIPVEKDQDTAERSDCMMVLENVQVDIDPASVFPAERTADDEESDDSSIEEVPRKREDPISLLTSSDDDDVILEEPHIDTVEVSDEDEDDVPLVKLVGDNTANRNTFAIPPKILWGTYDYYCYQCKYRTTSSAEYNRHKLTHSKVILVCESCPFTTASYTQLHKHKKKHKDEKRFKCHLCDYKAKHNMSLIYHLKCHESVSVNTLNIVDDVTTKRYFKTKHGYKCLKCKCVTISRSDMKRHQKICFKKPVKMYSCDKCTYATKRRSDLKRHRGRIHQDYDDDGDGDYVPPAYASVD